MALKLQRSASGPSYKIVTTEAKGTSSKEIALDATRARSAGTPQAEESVWDSDHGFKQNKSTLAKGTSAGGRSSSISSQEEGGLVASREKETPDPAPASSIATMDGGGGTTGEASTSHRSAKNTKKDQAKNEEPKGEPSTSASPKVGEELDFFEQAMNKVDAFFQSSAPEQASDGPTIFALVHAQYKKRAQKLAP